jgi:hypothetical protein
MPEDSDVKEGTQGVAQAKKRVEDLFVSNPEFRDTMALDQMAANEAQTHEDEVPEKHVDEIPAKDMPVGNQWGGQPTEIENVPEVHRPERGINDDRTSEIPPETLERKDVKNPKIQGSKEGH